MAAFCVLSCAVWPSQLPAELPLPSGIPSTAYRSIEPQHEGNRRAGSERAKAIAPLPVDLDAPAPVLGPLQSHFTSYTANELDEIKSRLAAIEAQTSAKPASDAGASASGQKWTVKVGGQVFFDYINWAGASAAIKPAAQDVANWRRLRIAVDGTGYGVYELRLQMDFDPDNDATNGVDEPYVAMKDAYFGIKELPLNGRLRFGHFFVPFSLEQMTPVANTVFMERAIPTSDIFSPSREVGIASYHISDDLNRALALGIFFDDIPESTKEVVDDNQGLRLATRAVWVPYYDEACNGRCALHTGIGFVYTDPRNDQARFRARPGEYRETQRLIDSGMIEADSYSVGNIELAAVSGPFSLESELFATSIDRFDADNVMLYGAYVTGSYFLTGEHRKYERDSAHLARFGRVTPYSHFFIAPGGTGWGAWEAKVRWAHLDFNELDRGQYNELTLGMNWYWTEHARLMFEWCHPWTSEDATVGNTAIGSTEADLLAMRLQFTF